MRDFSSPGRSPVHSMHGMACTSHPLATQLAVDILTSGGNALDAAIAACAMQCVVEPGMTGIGGDCFAMYAPGGRGVPIAFNGSGRSPAAATHAALVSSGVTEIKRDSPHSVIIPGAIDAWTQLHRDYGYMPFNELLQPAIDAARNGYPLASKVQYDINSQCDYLRQFEHTARIYLDDGEAPAVGSVRRLPELADALALISHEGRDGFYTGPLAEDMVDELQARGGLHTLDDFAHAQGEYVKPISSTFRGRTVYECPPNGQGLIALLLLNVMQGVSVDPAGPMNIERVHLEIEACRLAYASRDEWLADPAQANVPVDQLLSEAYANTMRSAIDPAQAGEQSASLPLPDHRDTVYISIVDKDRNACSFINTLFNCFGSGITTRSGILLTNRGTGFSMNPDNPNCIAPNKRPLHTIIPAMVAKGNDIELCFGVMGGQYQSMGHMQFLTRYYDFGCDIQEAMDLPRFMVNPNSGKVELENGIDEAIRAQLISRGHRLDDAPAIIGGSQAIAIDWKQGVLTGGSDGRKDGCAIGY